jgi:hypothetical protein
VLQKEELRVTKIKMNYVTHKSESGKEGKNEKN